MFSLAALVLLLSLHSTASFFYLKNVTWQEANETCDLATPPITDWKNVALELPNIPDEYRRTALWTGYYLPDIVIENIGCLSAANYTSTISITVTPVIGDIAYCFSVCKAAATIGIQRKRSTLYCYCLTNDESLHEDSVNHCTLIQENFQKTNYGGREDQIALYRKAENRLVSENEDKYARCVAYDIEKREYVYKHCKDKIGVFCQNNDDGKEPMSGLSWEQGADHCIDKSSVLPNEITPGLLDSLSNDYNVSHIWTRLQGKYTIIWKKPEMHSGSAITPVELFVCLKQLGDGYGVSILCDMRINAICNDPLPETCLVDRQMVGYENETVDLTFDLTVPISEKLHSYKIRRYNGNNITNHLIVGYRSAILIHQETRNNVTSIGNTSIGNLSIRIASMNQYFEGKYVLMQRQPLQMNITCIELALRVRPNIPVISTSDPGGNIVTGIEDKDVTLVCRSTGGYPKPTLRWYRTSNRTTPLATNTDQPQRDDRTYQLEYTFRANRTDDGATFICQSSYDPPSALYMQAEIELNISYVSPENKTNTVLIVGGTIAASVLVLVVFIVLLVMRLKNLRQRAPNSPGTSPIHEPIDREGSPLQDNASGIQLDLDDQNGVYYNIESNVYADLQETKGGTHIYGSLHPETGTSSSHKPVNRAENSSQSNASDEYKDDYYNIERNVYADVDETNRDTHDYGSLHTELDKNTNVRNDTEYATVELHN